MVEEEESTEEDSAKYEMDIKPALQDALKAKDDREDSSVDPAIDRIFDRNLRQPTAQVSVRNSAASQSISNFSKKEINQRNRKEYFEYRVATLEGRRMEESSNNVVVCSSFNCLADFFSPQEAEAAVYRAMRTIPHKKVFVTSASYNGNLGGVSGANQKCQSLATAVGLEGIFNAWVLSPSSNFDRSHDTIPYYLIDGTLLANDWADLTDGDIQNPINMDENGDIVPASARAWTATSSEGSAQVNDCGYWTSGSVREV